MQACKKIICQQTRSAHAKTRQQKPQFHQKRDPILGSKKRGPFGGPFSLLTLLAIPFPIWTQQSSPFFCLKSEQIQRFWTEKIEKNKCNQKRKRRQAENREKRQHTNNNLVRPKTRNPKQIQSRCGVFAVQPAWSCRLRDLGRR